MRRIKPITLLGVRIKTELIKQDITAKELAYRIGVSPMTVSDIISGGNKKRETINRVLKELGIIEIIDVV